MPIYNKGGTAWVRGYGESVAVPRKSVAKPMPKTVVPHGKRTRVVRDHCCAHPNRWFSIQDIVEKFGTAFWPERKYLDQYKAAYSCLSDSSDNRGALIRDTIPDPNAPGRLKVRISFKANPDWDAKADDLKSDSLTKLLFREFRKIRKYRKLTDGQVMKLVASNRLCVRSSSRVIGDGVPEIEV